MVKKNILNVLYNVLVKLQAFRNDIKKKNSLSSYTRFDGCLKNEVTSQYNDSILKLSQTIFILFYCPFMTKIMHSTMLKNFLVH